MDGAEEIKSKQNQDDEGKKKLRMKKEKKAKDLTCSFRTTEKAVYCDGFCPTLWAFSTGDTPLLPPRPKGQKKITIAPRWIVRMCALEQRREETQ